MQISTQTLLASQQAAQFQAKGAAGPMPGFAVALDKAEGFAPLPLKQVATAEDVPAMPRSSPGGPARVGAMVDIKI